MLAHRIASSGSGQLFSDDTQARSVLHCHCDDIRARSIGVAVQRTRDSRACTPQCPSRSCLPSHVESQVFLLERFRVALGVAAFLRPHIIARREFFSAMGLTSPVAQCVRQQASLFDARRHRPSSSGFFFHVISSCTISTVAGSPNLIRACCSRSFR